MSFLPPELLLPLEQLARGGGGGSGGGSSGGGGGAIEIILGYLPMHFVGALFARVSKKNEALKVVLSVLGWLIAIAYAWLWILWWPILGWLIAIAALVGMPAGLYSWFSKLKQSSLVKGKLTQAAQNDSAWDEQKLLAMAKNTFMQYQQDWSAGNTAAMQAYMTPRYYNHASLLMYTLQLMKRKDSMGNVRIIEMVIMDMVDAADNTHDSFMVGVTATAHDQLIDQTDEKVLYTDNGVFTEYWRFVRSGNGWLLDTIQQSTANLNAVNSGLSQFATVHGYYYSVDMGWLFIPKRGQLFGGAKFGTSDINNHIVGLYNNQLLVQLYSYVKDPNNNTKAYVIAQTNVPRSYGNIVVRRNKTFQLPIRGLQKVETEWTQFNKKYEVYASSAEQATSFELLDPTYMEQLEALPFEVNIEVVDNVIYLYTNERGSTVETYTTMLDLLNKAFKTMRL